MAWVVAGVSLPIFMIRGFLPPNLLISNPRLLLVISIALTLTGWLAFAKFANYLDITVLVTLGAFSLGFSIWLTILGMQGSRISTRIHLPTSLDGKVLSEAMRRPAVYLSLAMVTLLTSGVVYAASVWPLLSASPINTSDSSQGITVLIFFWIGGLLGGIPRLTQWEPARLGPLILVIVILLAAGVASVLSHCPVF